MLTSPTGPAEVSVNCFAVTLASVTTTSGSTVSQVILTAPPSNIYLFDVIQFTSGPLQNVVATILQVVGSTITLTADLPSAPGAGITATLRRYVPATLDGSGALLMGLPSGAATAANQTTEIGHLANLDLATHAHDNLYASATDRGVGIMVPYSADGIDYFWRYWPVSPPLSGALTGVPMVAAGQYAGLAWDQNITKLAGTAVDVNSGNISAGTLRIVQATDTPELTNAQPVKSKAATATTATITGLGQTQSIALNGALGLKLVYSGTYASIQLQFEASYDGGSTYPVGLYGYCEITNSRATSSAIDTNQTRVWEFDTQGLTHFRVRSTSYTSGTQNIRFLPIALGHGQKYTSILGSVSAAITATNFTQYDGNGAPQESVALGFYDTDSGAWTQIGGGSASGNRVLDTVFPATGDYAHDAADGGNPVKIGAKAIDMSPSSSGERGPTSVAADDRVNALYDLKGRMIEVPACEYTTLSAINTTYNNTTTTATSANITCWQYRQATLGFEISVASTPTLILFEVEVSLDGSNYETLVNDGLGAIVYSQATITAAGTLKRSYTFPIACQKIRVKVTATGTDASKTFTVDKSVLYLRN